MKAVIIFYALVFLTSCKDNSTLEPVKPIEKKDQIMPLTVGNRWVYATTYSYGQGDTIIWEVLSKTDVDIGGGKITAYGMNYYLKGSAQPDYQWLFSNKSDGLYVLGGLTKTDTLITMYLKLKYPSVENDSYQVIGLRYSRSNEIFYIKDTLMFSLVSTSDTLETPAGKFTGCYVYNYRIKQADDVSGFDDFHDYFVPGVGLVGTIVRTVVRNKSGGITYKLLLSSYSIK